MTTSHALQHDYPIGQPGVPWGESEKLAWLRMQTVKRSYQAEVLDTLDTLFGDQGPVDLQACAERVQYGVLDYSALGLGVYPLYAVRSKVWDAQRPWLLVTGGVHGYETSGVQGALRLIESSFVAYADRANLVVLPCISPWGYETINRWNPLALDPNRAFRPASGVQEAALAMQFLQGLGAPLVHLDLHETTDTDDSEFRPAKAARDGVPAETGEIPDGFYLVGDSERPQAGFDRAIIDAVRQVTHIAEPASDGRLLDRPMVQPGVIHYPKRHLGLCAAYTDAPYVGTTEVYPDSPRSTPDICQQAQVAAARAALDYALAAAKIR